MRFVAEQAAVDLRRSAVEGAFRHVARSMPGAACAAATLALGAAPSTSRQLLSRLLAGARGLSCVCSCACSCACVAIRAAVAASSLARVPCRREPCAHAHTTWHTPLAKRPFGSPPPTRRPFWRTGGASRKVPRRSPKSTPTPGSHPRSPRRLRQRRQRRRRRSLHRT